MKKILALTLALFTLLIPTCVFADNYDLRAQNPDGNWTPLQVDADGNLITSSITDLSQDATGVLPIANGGTGQDTASEAITALLAPSGAGDDGKVATYVHSAGRVQLEVPASANWTDATPDTYTTNTTRRFVMGGTASTYDAKLGVYGTEDVVTNEVVGASGQTANLQNWRINGGTIKAQMDIAGNLTVKSVTTTGTALSDDSFQGITFSATAGENLVIGDVCYIKSDGKLWKADADAFTTAHAVAIATTTILADATGVFGLNGFLRDDSGYNFTVGGEVYLSGTAGGITQTTPNAFLVSLGHALSADVLQFNPQPPKPIYSKSFSVTAITSAGDFGAIWKTPSDITIKAIDVVQVGATNVVGQLDECDSNGANCVTIDSSDITADGNDDADDGSLSNSSVDASDWIGWHTTSVSGTNTRITVNYKYTVN